MTAAATVAHSLSELEACVHRDLELLDYPRRPWVTPRQTADHQPILDVLILGGGQSGLGAAFALQREKVTNTLVLDAGEPGYEGPWRTFARMRTLRTPKYLTGPDLGIPSLTVRAWYEAHHGAGSWESLTFLPKEAWADYLAWYRKTLALPVRHNTRAGALSWSAENHCWHVPVVDTRTGATETRWARKVILATGIDGSGKWHAPPEITSRLPRHLWAHTHEAIDFAALRGKRIGVLGAGACSFDNAAVALEHGASSVDQFFRRPEMVRVNPYRWAEFVGFLKHHADLPDEWKWRFIRQILVMGQLPPADTFRRATTLPGHMLHADRGWRDVSAKGDTVPVVTTAGEEYSFDFVILGTGFQTDLSLRPELAHLHQAIALWSDRYTPPPGEEHADLARHPYLGPHFEMQARTPNTHPYLSSLFNYTFGGLPSMGFGGASISGMKYSLPRLAAGVTQQLYADDLPATFADLCAYAVEEF